MIAGWQEWGETRTLINDYGNVKLYNHIGKLPGSFLKNLNIHLPYGLDIPLLDIHPRKIKARLQDAIYKINFIPTHLQWIILEWN